MYIHVGVVAVLASYRTGLKLAAWYTLLLFTSAYAQSAHFIAVRESVLSSLPGGQDFGLVSSMNLLALWLVTLAAATVSAVDERELRAQKIDLEQLSSTVRLIDQTSDAATICRHSRTVICPVPSTTQT